MKILKVLFLFSFFFLGVTSIYASSTSSSVTVTVNQTAPSITVWTDVVKDVTGKAKITSGQKTTVHWEATGLKDPVRCTSPQSPTANQVFNGLTGQYITDSISSETTFTVTCTATKATTVTGNTTVYILDPISINPDLKVKINTGYIWMDTPSDGPEYVSYDPESMSGISSSGGVGYPYTLSWAPVANAVSCKLDYFQDVSPNGGSVTWQVSNWGANSTHKFDLVCKGADGTTGIDSVTLSYPPVVNNLTGSCNTTGTLATIKWTAPSGITLFYTRGSSQTRSDYPKTQMNGWNGNTALYHDDLAATTDSFTTFPNDIINYWVHSEAPNGAYGPAASGTVNCAPVDAATLSGLDCKIAKNESACKTALTLNITNPVSGAATNITKPVNIEVATGLTPASKSNIIVNYPSTTFYLNHAGSTLTEKTINASCVDGTVWDTTTSKCVEGVDLCSEAGVQTTYPCANGDICPEAGVQTTYPCANGDICPEAGVQTSLPCPNGDFCPQISGIQTSLPCGTIIPPTCTNGATNPPECNSNCAAPLTKNVTVECDAKNGIAAISGSVIRKQVKSAYPQCSFGTPVTNSNSTYVSDTCKYPGDGDGNGGDGGDGGNGGDGNGNGGGNTGTPIDGDWSGWTSRSTACPDQGTITRTCTNPAPANGGDKCLNKKLEPALIESEDYVNEAGKCPIFITGQSSGNDIWAEYLGSVLPPNQKIPYNSKVKVRWNPKNVTDCSCSYVDANMQTPLSCGVESPWLTASLKRDTMYTVSCLSLFGAPVAGSMTVPVSKIDASYIEN